MFGRRKGAVATVSENARAVRDYVDPLVRDDKLRRKLVTALSVGDQARRRARKHRGLTGLARRLATDPVLRQQLAELGSQVKGMQKRARKTHSHRTRNTVLVVAGTGVAVVAAWKLFAGGEESPEWQMPKQQPQDGVEVFAEGTDPSGAA